MTDLDQVLKSHGIDWHKDPTWTPKSIAALKADLRQAKDTAVREFAERVKLPSNQFGQFGPITVQWFNDHIDEVLATYFAALQSDTKEIPS